MQRGLLVQLVEIHDSPVESGIAASLKTVATIAKLNIRLDTEAFDIVIVGVDHVESAGVDIIAEHISIGVWTIFKVFEIAKTTAIKEVVIDVGCLAGIEAANGSIGAFANECAVGE